MKLVIFFDRPGVVAILQVSQVKQEGILLDKKSGREKQEPVSEVPAFSELQNPILCSSCRNSYPDDLLV